MKYYINYNTGAGNKWADTLEAAKELADDGAAYTQRPIIIEDEAPEENPICFGKFGYFGDWQ